MITYIVTNQVGENYLNTYQTQPTFLGAYKTTPTNTTISFKILEIED